MIVLAAILGVFAALLVMPMLALLVQVFMALRAYRPRILPSRRPRVGILIPAHDEATAIAETLGSILPQCIVGDRVLVVADNCFDETADIARGLGVEVVERDDPDHRGKGYALDFGMQHLQDDPPEVVIMVDADCQVHPGTIERLARACAETSRPVQALYLMRSAPRAKSQMRIAEFAWVMRNHIRPLGNHRLGLPCQLMGTGMAFPWSAIRKVALASGHIVEDMKLGVDLALAGYPAIFFPDALVTSHFPENKIAEGAQRVRWEHGHLSVILHEVPRMLVRALRERNLALLGLAMDLMVPPLSLLALFVSVVFLASLMLFLSGEVIWPLYLSLLTSSLLAVAVALAWFGWGRTIVPLRQLFAIPFYMMSKIPLYLRFLTARQKTWIKTRRN
jgi:cellulose synthase/poly-beta-1,6-N-acetylglucosamine synthase-like glycosyltransferase